MWSIGNRQQLHSEALLNELYIPLTYTVTLTLSLLVPLCAGQHGKRCRVSCYCYLSYLSLSISHPRLLSRCNCKVGENMRRGADEGCLYLSVAPSHTIHHRNTLPPNTRTHTLLCLSLSLTHTYTHTHTHTHKEAHT